MNQSTLRKFLWPALLSVCVLGLIGRASSIVDSYDKAPPAGATLTLPSSYVAMSPVSRTLDVLSLLSIPQTVWLFGVMALVVIWRIIATRSDRQRKLWLRLVFGIVGLIAVVA
ncbi:MAG TPA: hypothetical protein VFC35_05155, partial [Gemmatimonadaceae bacterium]|nr:hypothetical protein [Gemmatimonadaceae bacterium]